MHKIEHLQQENAQNYTFLDRCEQLRARLHLTIEELSDHLGYSRSTMQQIRAGKMEPSKKLMARLKEAEETLHIKISPSPPGTPTINDLLKDPKKHAKIIAELTSALAATMKEYPADPQINEDAPLDTKSAETPAERAKLQRLEKEKGKMLTPQKKPAPMFGYQPRRLAP